MWNLVSRILRDLDRDFHVFCGKANENFMFCGKCQHNRKVSRKINTFDNPEILTFQNGYDFVPGEKFTNPGIFFRFQDFFSI